MWKCSECNELIEDQFGACWKCGSSKQKGEQLSVDEIPPMQAPEQAITESTEKCIGYAQMWAQSVQLASFWVGIGMLLLATILTTFIAEEAVPNNLLKVFRLSPMLLVFVGIIVGNIGFRKSILGKMEIKSPLKFLFHCMVGLVGGFFANSFFAETFGYSLRPAEAAYCWLIIGAIAIIIGSITMFFSTRKANT